MEEPGGLCRPLHLVPALRFQKRTQGVEQLHPLVVSAASGKLSHQGQQPLDGLGIDLPQQVPQTRQPAQGVSSASRGGRGEEGGGGAFWAVP